VSGAESRRRVAILAVGDELLGGDSPDTNSAWLARAVRARGHGVAWLNVVGDSLPGMVRVVQRAESDADLLLVTGGLGPTNDDITRDGVAQAFDLALEERPGLIVALEAWTLKRGKPLSAGSRRQAEMPVGAKVLANPNGTAPGFLLEHGDLTLACLPGVPSEMKPMADALLPVLLPDLGAHTSRRLLACGPAEADLGERIADLMDHLDSERSDLRVGLTAKLGVLILTVRGHDERAVAQMEMTLRERLGEDLFGVGDETLAGCIVSGLAARGLTLAVAESCTGGLLCGAITSVPGASAVLQDGAVTYSNAAKTARLGVSPELIAEHGAVSEPVAEAMARGVRASSGADLGLAVTGVAGPDGGSPDKPVGTVVFALSHAGGSRAMTRQWQGARNEVRERSVHFALELVRRHLLLLLLTLGMLSCTPSSPKRAPNVLIWMVDTLRADHLGCYGYERPTSPNMDALAADGVLFREAHMPSNWTQPSVASLLSGRYPVPFAEDFTASVPDELTMAAEWYSRHGYATAGFTTTVATAAWYGFAQGYDTYEETDLLLDGSSRKNRESPVHKADHLVDTALRWLDQRSETEQPFFLYLHSVDPHAPYESHAGQTSFAQPYDGPMDGSVRQLAWALQNDYSYTDADTQHMLDLYDDDIRFNDHWFGELRAALAERGLEADTLIVVVSDHGEEFGERGAVGHGHASLHREQTHVPLIMAWPGTLPAGTTVDGLVGGVDVLPTLLELTGLPPIPAADGVSWASAARAESTPGVDGEAEAVVYVDRAKNEWEFTALRTPDWFFQLDAQEQHNALYDLKADPGEQTDLSGQRPELARELRDRLQRWRADRAERQATLLEARRSVERSDEMWDKLRALGYIGPNEKRPTSDG
jgi:nicotinamide-nucleotide amidase